MTTKAKHTAGPFVYHHGRTQSHLHGHSGYTGVTIPMDNPLRDRILSALNALEGIADPGAVPAAIEALRSLQEIAPRFQEGKRDGYTMGQISLAMDAAEKALSRLAGEGGAA